MSSGKANIVDPGLPAHPWQAARSSMVPPAGRSPVAISLSSPRFLPSHVSCHPCEAVVGSGGFYRAHPCSRKSRARATIARSSSLEHPHQAQKRPVQKNGTPPKNLRTAWILRQRPVLCRLKVFWKTSGTHLKQEMHARPSVCTHTTNTAEYQFSPRTSSNELTPVFHVKHAFLFYRH